MRGDRRGAGETYQTLCALTVVIVSVGLALGAVHAATERAAKDAAHARALLQADIALDAFTGDPSLETSPGVLGWGRALNISAGRVALTFAPSSLRIASLRSVMAGEELFLAGSAGGLDPHLVFASRPVSILMPSGHVEPGILRVGVEVVG